MSLVGKCNFRLSIESMACIPIPNIICVPVSSAPALHKFMQMYSSNSYYRLSMYACKLHLHKSARILGIHSHTLKNHQFLINHIAHPQPSPTSTSFHRLSPLVHQRKTNISPAIFPPPQRNVNILMIQHVRCCTVVLAIALEKSYWIVSNVPLKNTGLVGGVVGCG